MILHRCAPFFFKFSTVSHRFQAKLYRKHTDSHFLSISSRYPQYLPRNLQQNAKNRHFSLQSRYCTPFLHRFAPFYTEKRDFDHFFPDSFRKSILMPNSGRVPKYRTATRKTRYKKSDFQENHHFSCKYAQRVKNGVKRC